MSRLSVATGGLLFYRIITGERSANPVVHFLPATQVLDVGSAKLSIAGQVVKLYA
jgi:hypothetical protein